MNRQSSRFESYSANLSSLGDPGTSQPFESEHDGVELFGTRDAQNTGPAARQRVSAAQSRHQPLGAARHGVRDLLRIAILRSNHRGQPARRPSPRLTKAPRGSRPIRHRRSAPPGATPTARRRQPWRAAVPLPASNAGREEREPCRTPGCPRRARARCRTTAGSRCRPLAAWPPGTRRLAPAAARTSRCSAGSKCGHHALHARSACAVISGVLRSNGSVPQPRQNVGMPPSRF